MNAPHRRTRPRRMIRRFALILIGAVALNIVIAWVCAIRANRTDMHQRARIDSVLGYAERWEENGAYGFSLRDSGWPHLSMCVAEEITKVTPGGPLTREARSEYMGLFVRGIEVPSLRRMVGKRKLPRIILPLVPVWPGFVANTLIYALILSSPWLVVFGLRKSHEVASCAIMNSRICEEPELDDDRPPPRLITSMLDPLSRLTLQLGLIAAAGAVLYKATIVLDSIGLASLVVIATCMTCGGVSLRSIADGGPVWAVSWLRVSGILSCSLPFIAGMLSPSWGGSRYQWSPWLVAYEGGWIFACLAISGLPIILLHCSLRQRWLAGGWILTMFVGFVLLGAPTIVLSSAFGGGMHNWALSSLPLPVSGYATNTWVIAFFLFTLLAWYRLRVAASQRHVCCLDCGYDLSATPGGMPCPECGGSRE